MWVCRNLTRKGNTEEDNNGYAVCKRNIQGSAGKKGGSKEGYWVGYSARPLLFLQAETVFLNLKTFQGA